MIAVNKDSLISVIMACYNADQYLIEAIESVFRQTYTNIELIVVDDGSTDGSKDILRRYGDRIVLIEQNNSGPYPARNRGLRECKGEFAAFLDSDDYWRSDCLEKLHKALTESKAALAYCGWQNIGLPAKRGEPYIPPNYELENKVERFLREASPWPIHAALMHRDVLMEEGGFNEELKTCMDYDLWLRVAVSRQLIRVPEVLAFYRHHNDVQITSKQWRQAKNVWLVKKKFVREYPHLVAKFSHSKLKSLIHGALLRRGYAAYWNRDLVSSHKIFQMVLITGYFRLQDLKYLLPALLPSNMYIKLIQKADSRSSNK
jgi:glycosyltransferase involved in cell wall biosynthesis